MVETESLQKKLSLWKENRAVLGEWIRLNSDAKTMGELLRRFIEAQEEAVRDCAKEIQPLTDFDYWTEWLYKIFGNKGIGTMEDEVSLKIALVDKARNILELLVGSNGLSIDKTPELYKALIKRKVLKFKPLVGSKGKEK